MKLTNWLSGLGDSRATTLTILAGALSLMAGEAGARDISRSEAIESARVEFNSSLKDYDSARFRNARIAADMTGICGEVNAKNSMGGYTGWTKFYVAVGGAKAMLVLADDVVMASVAADMCSDPDTSWLGEDVSAALAKGR